MCKQNNVVTPFINCPIKRTKTTPRRHTNCLHQQNTSLTQSRKKSKHHATNVMCLAYLEYCSWSAPNLFVIGVKLTYGEKIARDRALAQRRAVVYTKYLLARDNYVLLNCSKSTKPHQAKIYVCKEVLTIRGRPIGGRVGDLLTCVACRQIDRGGHNTHIASLIA